MIVGTAGHVNHGKTSLVRALTGIDTDRLKEEKRRGITIDLGFAYLPADDEPIGFVDVPGHERFVHTMLAGATGIDFVLLVIAANDGPMPQTREHLQILNLLGQSRGLVALTKVDRVEPDMRMLACEETRELLSGTFLADAEIISMSAVTGEGLDEIKQRLLGAAAETRPHSENGYFRMAVDRRFTLPGIGTVVTGTALSGSVSTGSCLRILPQGFEARIRSIHANNREVEACRTGQRCALAIAGAEIDKDNIHRGDWIVAPEVDHLTTKLDTHLRLLEPEKRAIGRQTSVHFHIGAAAMVARIGALDPPSITQGGEGLARILLPGPIHAASGDRFIIRDASARRTIGGGVVLDPDPPARGQRKADRIALLNRWREGPAAALTALLETNPGGVDLKHFAVLTNRRPENIDRMVSRAHTIRIAVPSGGQAFSRTRWLEAKKKVRITLVRMHRRAPEETGADAETLRRTAANVMSPSAFAQLLGEMRTAGEIAASGRWLHLPDHRVEIIESERRLWQQIQTLLARDPIRPDRSRTFGPLLRVDDARVTKILRRQALANEVFLIAEDYYVLREGVVEFAALVTEEANAKGQVTAAMLRDRLGTGRKMAIWILEFLDRLGYCRRVGDAHVPTGRTLEDLFAT